MVSHGISTYLKPAYASPPLSARFDGPAQPGLATGSATAVEQEAFPVPAGVAPIKRQDAALAPQVGGMLPPREQRSGLAMQACTLYITFPGPKTS
jgi:hypothetical protein